MGMKRFRIVGKVKKARKPGKGVVKRAWKGSY
jgi:hypothetical protein